MNKKKQENFYPVGQGRDAANAPAPEAQKFFGSFFQKRTAYLISKTRCSDSKKGEIKMTQTLRRRIDLFCVWCGPAYVFFLFLGWGPIAGLVPFPSPSQTPQQVVAFFHENHIRIIIGMVVVMWGAILFIPFSCLIADFIARFEGTRRTLTYIFVMSAFANAMFTFYPPAWWIDMAYRPDTPTDIMYFMNDVCWLQFLGNVALIAPFYLVVAVMALFDDSPQPVFPRWVGYLNIWTVIGMLPITLIYFFYSGPFAWNGLIGAWLPVTVFDIWFIFMTYYVRKAVLLGYGVAAPVPHLARATP